MNPARKAKRTVALILEALEDRTVPALVGNQLFPADNPWNQKITNAPLASNSAAIIGNITSHYGNGRLHPDFGQDYHDGSDLYGIPYNIVHGNSIAKTSVVIDAYPDESDIFAAPLPATVVIEGDFQNGPKVGVDNRGDSHLLLYDVDNNVAYEFYRMSRPSENSDGKWHADQETVWDMKANTFRTLGWTSADAAGLSLLAGLVRPDEGLPVSQGGQGVINHAIRFTLQNSIILNQFTYPASHVANSGSNTAVQPPMGARFRLNANVDISQLNPESRIIAQAMKDYGMIVADNGSNFFFSGASYSVDASNQQTLTWNDNDIQDSVHGLKSLHFTDFEVVDLTPQVTDLSLHTGSAGSTVTVTGSNFTGAAGHLLVLFGTTPATNVTVVNDTTVTCVAPAGLSGTVDVRVQSGVTTANNPQNYKGTIFGYGISAVTTNDRFTFGGSTNQPPTVASPATASSNPVTGFSVNLSVLGADDAGEANLKYTWTSTGPAAVTYSSNGSNASKNTTANFTQAGVYNFTVTIADAPGLSVTSSVSVTVNAPNQAPTVATAAHPASNPVTGNSVGLLALGADDGGEPNLKYTWAGTGPGTVTYSSNGSNSSKNTTATFSQPGVYSFVVTIADAQGLSVSSSTSVTVNAANQAPTVATAAHPASNPVTGSSVGLLVLGADDGGEPNLKYTWAGTGPGTVTYSSNGSNSSKNTTATFSQPGVYSFVVTIADAQGLTVTSSTSVTVNAANQAPTVATPARPASNPVTGNSVDLLVLGADDGGEANLKYTWVCTGPGTVTYSSNGSNSSKNTTATFSQPGVYSFVVTIADAQGLTVTSSTSVTVNAANQAPTVATAAHPASNPVTGTSVSLSVLGADDNGEANLNYSWTSNGPAAVTYTSNGNNASKNTTANFTQPGVYAFLATITDAQGLSVTSSVSVTVNTNTNQPPTVATPAKASASTVTGRSVLLSVLGADDGGAANLKYTWTSTGPAPVQFSNNGTNSALNTTATFSSAGVYSFMVTITDVGGLSVTSSVNVTVKQTLTAVVVKPATATVKVRNTLQFTATALDQFSTALTTQPTIRWMLGGYGTLTSHGLYTAPRTRGGPYSIIAIAVGTVRGVAKVTVVS
ncbi:MAG TPA: IPT/TIG domain-containing protein [Gemmatales bacterium]|nr:IPT/TIG domain-containing protein [Gemmatales bacterium]